MPLIDAALHFGTAVPDAHDALRELVASATHVARSPRGGPGHNFSESDLRPFLPSEAGNSYLCRENVRTLQKRGCGLMAAAIILSSPRNLNLAHDRFVMRGCPHQLSGLVTIQLGRTRLDAAV